LLVVFLLSKTIDNELKEKENRENEIRAKGIRAIIKKSETSDVAKERHEASRRSSSNESAQQVVFLWYIYDPLILCGIIMTHYVACYGTFKTR